MKRNIKIIIPILTCLLVCLLPSILHAQAPGFGDDTGDAPVDGGLSLLIAAGAGYGIQKIKDKRNKPNTK